MSEQDKVICEEYMDILRKFSFVEALEFAVLKIKDCKKGVQNRYGLEELYLLLLEQQYSESIVFDVLVLIKNLLGSGLEFYSESIFNLFFIMIVNMRNNIDSNFKCLLLKMKDNVIYNDFLKNVEECLREGLTLNDIIKKLYLDFKWQFGYINGYDEGGRK